MDQVMREKRVPGAPTLRCYVCGSSYIAAVCHHCGYGMCSQHCGEATPAKVGVLNALAVAFGARTLEEQQLEDYGIQVKRISLWHEFLSQCKVIEISNPEYHLTVDNPPRVSGAIPEQIRWFWRRISSVLRKFLFALPPAEQNPIGAPHHCRECAHYVTYYRPWLITVVAAAALGSIYAVLVLWLNLLGLINLPPIFRPLRANPDLYILALPAALTCVLVSLILLSIFRYHNLRTMRDDLRTQYEHIPVPGHISQISVKEQRRGTIRLDDQGNYRLSIDRCYGVLKAPIQFSPLDLRNYYYRFINKAEVDLGVARPEQRDLQVGFLCLSAHRWKILSGSADITRNDRAFPLKYIYPNNPLDELRRNPRLPGVKNEDFVWYYRVIDVTDHIARLPLQVIGRLPPNTESQVVELEFEMIDPDKLAVSGVRIESLELLIPTDLGPIDDFRPDGKIEPQAVAHPAQPGKLFKKITWKRLEFSSGSAQQGKPSRYPLTIRFKNKINLDARFQGELNLRIPAAESGLRNINVTYPCGTLRSRPKLEIETRYLITLDLSLASLRYQTLEVCKWELEKDGVSPDTYIVTKISDCLAGEDFYIKRIAENPARLSNENATKFNRYWDINGRKYEGIYPIDFHLIIIGEESNPKLGGNTGKLKAILSVHAPVTDNAMRKQVAEVTDRLAFLIESSI